MIGKVPPFGRDSCGLLKQPRWARTERFAIAEELDFGRISSLVAVA
jgi:hypothetical protein